MAEDRYQCFCGGTIDLRGRDPVELLIPLPGGGTQGLYCHLACLQRALHPSVPLGLFEDDEDE